MDQGGAHLLLSNRPAEELKVPGPGQQIFVPDWAQLDQSVLGLLPQVSVEQDELLQESVIRSDVSAPPEGPERLQDRHVPVDDEVGQDAGGGPGDSHLAADHHPASLGQHWVDVVGGHTQVGQDVAQGRVPDCEAEIGNTTVLEVIWPQVYQAYSITVEVRLGWLEFQID